MRRSWTIAGLLLAASAALAQTWSEAYERGLQSARLQQWANAREAFQAAIAFRPEDQSRPTRLPGPVTETRDWRDGAPYSPNFLAAYAAYRSGLQTTSRPAQEALFREAMDELEVLLAKGQASREAVYILSVIYDKLDQRRKRDTLFQQFSDASRLTWRVDREVMMPEEVAVIDQFMAATTTGTTTAGGPTRVGAMPEIRAGQDAGPAAAVVPGIVGRVPVAGDKFALLIGNTNDIAGLGVPFAAEDVEVLRDALVTHGGYAESQVTVLQNATAQQIMEAANQIAERIAEDAPVFLYFTGVGVNLDGRDYLAGQNAGGPHDTSNMLRKTDLYNVFMNRGAQLFAFFQVNRPIRDGRYFGMEIPMVGAISQAQATAPGEMVNAFVRNSRRVGLYTDAMAGTLAEFKSNRVPIMNFGWQVFYRMRTGGVGGQGGGSRQVPTLPVLTNLGSYAPF